MKLRLIQLLAASAFGSLLISQQRPGAVFSPYVDAGGNISRPRDYRENWAHLGTYFVLGETAENNTMHSVYTEKRHLESYNETGGWPDGTVIVKEVMHTAAARLTTGAANWATDPSVWFVVIKDGEERFPGHPLWGDGWGWALFKSDAPNTQVAADYKRDCLNCHLPARETDFVYIQGYPAIHERPKSPDVAPRQTAAGRAENVDFASGPAERGAEIFRETCSFCHTAESDKRKTGPGLAVISREGRLPSGKAATAESILDQINNGGGGMPAFAGSLEAREKADLIAYLRRPN